MTNRNKMFARILKQEVFAISPSKTERSVLFQFEAEGLVTLTDASDGIHTLWQVQRAFRPYQAA